MPRTIGVKLEGGNVWVKLGIDEKIEEGDEIFFMTKSEFKRYQESAAQRALEDFLDYLKNR